MLWFLWPKMLPSSKYSTSPCVLSSDRRPRTLFRPICPSVSPISSCKGNCVNLRHLPNERNSCLRSTVGASLSPLLHVTQKPNSKFGSNTVFCCRRLPTNKLLTHVRRCRKPTIPSYPFWPPVSSSHLELQLLHRVFPLLLELTFF